MQSQQKNGPIKQPAMNKTLLKKKYDTLGGIRIFSTQRFLIAAGEVSPSHAKQISANKAHNVLC